MADWPEHLDADLRRQRSVDVVRRADAEHVLEPELRDLRIG